MAGPNPTMENVVHLVGDVSKRGGRSDGVSRDAIATDRSGGDEVKVGGANECGVAAKFNKPPGTHQYGPKF